MASAGDDLDVVGVEPGRAAGGFERQGEDGRRARGLLPPPAERRPRPPAAGGAPRPAGRSRRRRSPRVLSPSCAARIDRTVLAYAARSVSTGTPRKRLKAVLSLADKAEVGRFRAGLRPSGAEVVVSLIGVLLFDRDLGAAGGEMEEVSEAGCGGGPGRQSGRRELSRRTARPAAGPREERRRRSSRERKAGAGRGRPVSRTGPRNGRSSSFALHGHSMPRSSAGQTEFLYIFERHDSGIGGARKIVTGFRFDPILSSATLTKGPSGPMLRDGEIW